MWLVNKAGRLLKAARSRPDDVQRSEAVLSRNALREFCTALLGWKSDSVMSDMMMMGTSINDITQFNGKIDPPAQSVMLDHLMTISYPHTEITSQAYSPTPFKKAVNTACRNKPDSSCVIPTSTVNMTLLAFATECHAASAAVPPVVYAQHSAANLLHVGAAVA